MRINRLLLALASVLPLSAAAAPMVGLTGDQRLAYFDSATPNTIFATVNITGLVAGETLVGIDNRPATGTIVGLGRAGRIYQISQAGAAVPATAAASTTALNGAAFGVDFNPAVDRLRVVSDSDQNLRFHPDTGAVAGVDTPLAPAGDKVAAAYDQNVAGTTTTTLFLIDSTTDTLVRQGGVNGTPSPNTGAITEIGPLGVNTSAASGFDISGTGEVRAVLTVAGTPGLYNVNLATGAATLIGTFPGSVTVTDATFVVGFPAVTTNQLPTLGTWGIIGLSSLLLLAGVTAARRFS